MNDIVIVLLSAAVSVVTSGCIIFSIMYHKDVEELMSRESDLRKKLSSAV